MYLIDTHIHLGAPAYANDLDLVLKRALTANVKKYICIGAGYGLKSMQDAIALSTKYSSIFAAVGLHPCEAQEHEFEAVKTYAVHDRVVAIGETGLDFYHSTKFTSIQEEQFRKHIQLARSIKKPLIIHSRSAGQRCLEILIEEQAKDAGGVFHCFGEDEIFAEKLLNLNFLISIPGIITFKNAIQLREVVSKVPLSQIMLETDGPFLAPQRVRGQRAESAHVVDVAETIAKVKNISFEEVVIGTTQNAERLFRI